MTAAKHPAIATPSGTSPHHAAPYTDGFVDVAGLRLHYLDYGRPDRPAMLCLHGGAAHAHWYDFVASAFVRDHRVIALEHRGHGDSAWSSPPDYTYERYAADVAEFAEKLDLHDFTLVGHSVGGLNALLYAARTPGRVRRLVLVDSTLKSGSERAEHFRRMTELQTQPHTTREDFIEAYRLNPPETSASPEVVRYLACFDGRQGTDGLWRKKIDPQFYSQRQWVHGLEHWNDIAIPVLLIKAAASHRITPDIASEVEGRCRTARLTTVANSNHHVMLDNPGEFVRVVREFVTTT